MDLVLLACSKRKQCGGVPDYTQSKQLAMGLSPESFGKLLNLRSKVVSGSEKNLPIGPDVGIPGDQVTAQYLPAYQRYTGIVFERGRVQELYPTQSNIRLVIISALYGLLDGHDLIQKYDLKMNEKISGQCANTWWKSHSLGKM